MAGTARSATSATSRSRWLNKSGSAGTLRIGTSRWSLGILLWGDAMSFFSGRWYLSAFALAAVAVLLSDDSAVGQQRTRETAPVAGPTLDRSVRDNVEHLLAEGMHPARPDAPAVMYRRCSPSPGGTCTRRKTSASTIFRRNEHPTTTSTAARVMGHETDSQGRLLP